MWWRAGLIALAVAAAGSAASASSFTLVTSAFLDGGLLPKLDAAMANGCGGRNISPPLHLVGFPAATRSLAIVVFDTDAGAGRGFTHWVAYGIAPTVTEWPPGFGSRAAPAFTGGTNDAGTTIYYGPCPPRGAPAHHYVFTAYALDLAPARLRPGLTRAAFQHRIAGHVLAEAKITATYSR